MEEQEGFRIQDGIEQAEAVHRNAQVIKQQIQVLASQYTTNPVFADLEQKAWALEEDASTAVKLLEDLKKMEVDA